jgi:hypothetical protein
MRPGRRLFTEVIVMADCAPEELLRLKIIGEKITAWNENIGVSRCLYIKASVLRRG